MFRPYFLIKPALCVQTRLFSKPKSARILPLTVGTLCVSSCDLNRPPLHVMKGFCSPGAGTLAVGSWTRVPDGFVRHVCGLTMSRCWCRLGRSQDFVVAMRIRTGLSVGAREISIPLIQPIEKRICRPTLSCLGASRVC